MGDRRAGLILPLFSCPSSTSWGIGELTDLAPVCEWLESCGLRAWQLLPINEMAPGQQSPYSAISAMAIDPIFISLPNIPDFAALGGDASLSADDRAALDAARRSPHVDHKTVRRLKRTALRAAFTQFVNADWRRKTDRAAAMQTYLATQAWWIEDYALFRAIHEREGNQPWTKWPEPLQRREPAAIDAARRELAQEVLFYQYQQWIADGQWRDARRIAHGVKLFGDLPFMVDGDSADVWSRQHQFRSDATIGAPPDAFSAEGQNWGTPVYRWDVIAREGFQWLRERARRCADLFDGFRVDHLVGFFRTYARPIDGSPAYFTPDNERDQRALGERVLAEFRGSGSDIIAEDLGTVPDFVRESLARLNVPGLKVFRWERYWHTDGQPFRRPVDYPAMSVAVSGTHDTEPMIAWWEQTPLDEKEKVSVAVPAELVNAPYDRVRDVLVEALFASGSDLALFPIQDVFGWRDRINDPSIVDDTNWVYRLPWPSDEIADATDAQERRKRLRAWSLLHGRSR